jgi:hypothetical protein
MAPRFDRRMLSKAKPRDLIRLARFIGVVVPDDCICDDCNHKLIEAVIRKLDEGNMANSWPPRLMERKW